MQSAYLSNYLSIIFRAGRQGLTDGVTAAPQTRFTGMSMLRDDQAPKSDAAVLSEINITPFTDVLLVLLIIFMILASLAIPPGFERQFAPCACGAPLTKTPPHVVVVVNRRGDIFVEGRHTSIAMLYSALSRIHGQAPRATITLYADAKAPYGAIMRVLDAGKAGGVPDVSFIVQ